MSKEKDDLLSWYDNINEEAEIAKITVPVLTHDDDIENQDAEQEPEKVVIVKEPEDKVVSKDKTESLAGFILAKRIQDLLVRAAGLAEPYEADSEERQNLVDQIKKLYLSLGEKIGSL